MALKTRNMTSDKDADDLSLGSDANISLPTTDSEKMKSMTSRQKKLFLSKKEKEVNPKPTEVSRSTIKGQDQSIGH